MFIRLAKVQRCLQQGDVFRTEDGYWVERSTRRTPDLGLGYKWTGWRAPRIAHPRASARTVVRLGRSKKFGSRGVAESDEWTSFEIVLPFLPADIDETICDEAMDDELRTLSWYCIALAYIQYGYAAYVLHYGIVCIFYMMFLYFYCFNFRKLDRTKGWIMNVWYALLYGTPKSLALRSQTWRRFRLLCPQI